MITDLVLLIKGKEYHYKSNKTGEYMSETGCEQVNLSMDYFSCWDCVYRIGEECDLYGHEVYQGSEPCIKFTPIDEE
jgi:hypothetical protein